MTTSVPTGTKISTVQAQPSHKPSQATRRSEAEPRQVGGPDLLLTRGPGDGHIDLPGFIAAVAAARYQGDVEVEIFNADVWAAPPEQVVATLARRHVALVADQLTPPPA